MQATFDSRTAQTVNNQWNFANTFNQSRASSFSGSSSTFGSPSLYSPMSMSMSRGIAQPSSSSFYSPKQSGYGSAQSGTMMTQFQREISRTPDSMSMKTSYSTYQQFSSNTWNNVPGKGSHGSHKDSQWDACDRNKVAPVVSQNGNKLNVDMGNTHAELSKDKATTKINDGDHNYEFTGWGDPHGVLKIDGKETKADFSKPLGLDTNSMRVTMDPEQKASSSGAPPHMDRVIYEPKGTKQVFVGEHLSPSDKSNVSFREVKDKQEKDKLRQVANNAQKADPEKGLKTDTKIV
ncbi:hypothetical protein [Paraburkholderia rhizosphaerae]|uniref:Uncharacterized protein n=1 Tax=Paraburkholderia rhizosphaerae TaxID=480658 RepID=A0A4R8LZV8_9BURK|nr:hypothetical protein [Paraburkholderia rhizosphaerae]TDY53562.1 hypothetical protein BX592_103375 [Paraburkholderia rhizosphaerae]